MKLIIDKSSSVPIYKQIINAIRRGTMNGSIVNGEKLPSLNQFAKQMGISKETIKNAYWLLKKEGMISGRRGKGYYIDVKDSTTTKKVIMFLDSLSPYKQCIYEGAASELRGRAEITIKVFNLDIELLEKMVEEAVGYYDWYMIAPHFHKQTDMDRVILCLKRFPIDRLILLDKEMPSLSPRIGRVCQDFSNDAGEALKNEQAVLSKYTHAEIIVSDSSLYYREIIPSITAVLKNAKLSISTSYSFEPEQMKPGVVFIVIDGLLNSNYVGILREVVRKGYSLGKEIGLISYNDIPINEFISGGLTCLSSDFEEMGRRAAQMIISGKQEQIHNPFRLIIRNSL